MAGRNSRVNSRDVARLANVSQSSVSRAFTPGSNLSDEKRSRILEAAGRLNYVPNSAASMLITRRSNTIALIVGNTENPFYIAVLKEFLGSLRDRGRQVLTFVVEPGSSNDDAIMRILQHQVDGIILTSAQLSTRSTTLCQERDIPVVLFNRYIPQVDMPAVLCDNSRSAGRLAEAFLSAGARSFAIVRGDPLGTTSQDRASGFADALRSGGIAPSEVREIEGGSVYNSAFDAICDTYHGRPHALPDAIFAVNDAMAMAVIDALRYKLGKRVPEDVLVAGFDGISEAAREPYRLTTMRQPVEQMVSRTVDILLMDAEPADDKAGDAKDLAEAGDSGQIATDTILDCEMIWGTTLPPS